MRLKHGEPPGELHTEKSSTILITPILHRELTARLQLSTSGLRNPIQSLQAQGPMAIGTEKDELSPVQ